MKWKIKTLMELSQHSRYLTKYTKFRVGRLQEIVITPQVYEKAEFLYYCGIQKYEPNISFILVTCLQKLNSLITK